uniref:Small ribosomal subunit protein bS16c n=1 Tax=Leptosiphonia brodiei TaxID=2608611 RepID=A0A1Z1MB11_9FLOR|nr:ribosomal protein S16 [Leptosiphonia brodiei]ARW63005.1 ribosomal protein S16 [Leptosiphonia brodiei]
MLKIRLKKLGRKKKPFYRIILIDSRKKRDSKAIEELGFYNPINKNSKLDIKTVLNKKKEGAMLTKTVETLLHQMINK